MDKTLIENLNAMMQVKKDLNNVLKANGVEGGEIFDSYPEKFRELFRIIENGVDDINEGPYSNYQPITNVADPVIRCIDNIIYITCATPGAEIYFRNDYEGWGQYILNYYIEQDTFIEAYAVLNGTPSSIVSYTAHYTAPGSLPVPYVDRTDGILTITHVDDNVNLWWRIYPGTFVRYNGPVEISNIYTIEAYASYLGFASDIVRSEGSGEVITVDDPEFSCEYNLVTITCDTVGAVIYYKIGDEEIWHEYSEPVEISADVVFTAYAILEGVQSNEVEYLADYIDPGIRPSVPVVTQEGNTLTITCSTEGATIYYSTDGEDGTYTEYEGPIDITENTTVWVFSEYNGLQSVKGSYSATYYDAPNAPTFSYQALDPRNIIVRTTSDNAIIYYRIDGGSWTTLETSPYLSGGVYGIVTIYSDCLIEAYAERYGVPSTISSMNAIYYEDLWFTNRNNIVSINSSRDDITIEYRYRYRYNSSYNLWTDWTSWNVYDRNTSGIGITGSNYLYEFEAKYKVNGYSRYSKTIPYSTTVDNNVYWGIIIENSNNIITIAEPQLDNNGIIKYRIDGGSWITYTGSFEITEDCLIEAYSTYLGDGDIYSLYCTYIPFNKRPLTIKFNQSGTFDFGRTNDNVNTPVANITIVQHRKETSNNRVTGGIWYTDINNSSTGSVNNGDIFEIYTADNYHGDFYYGYKFSISSYCEVYGNIMSLVYKEKFFNYNTAGENAFAGLFRNNTYLQKANNLILPYNLNYRTLANLFSYCSSLTHAPTISAGRLGTKCCESMFSFCTSLQTAPALPSTTLAQECYNGMFWNCEALTTAPELPATVLAPWCYYNMFMFCTRLTTSPVLPALTLVEGCYSRMFYNCNILSKITCYATNISATDCITDMTFSVSGDNGAGVFVKSLGMDGWLSLYPNTTQSSLGYKVLYEPELVQNGNDITLTTKTNGADIYYSLDGTNFTKYTQYFEIQGDVTVYAYSTYRNGQSFTAVYNVEDQSNNQLGFSVLTSGTLGWQTNHEEWVKTIQYKINNGSWTNWTPTLNGNFINVSAGDIIKVKGHNSSYYGGSFGDSSGRDKINSFTATCTFNLSGDLLSLTNYELVSNSFNSLFANCTGVKSCQYLNLPAITAMGCYEKMFAFSSITEAPNLPATIVTPYCYRMMFKECTSLTTTPISLPAMNVQSYGYQWMFEGCTSLRTVQFSLPATIVGSLCYYGMFKDCTSLTTAPDMADAQMLDVVDGSEPPAGGWTTSLQSYKEMFYGCSSLNYVKCLSTKNYMWYDDFQQWLYGVAVTGTFVKKTGSEWYRDEHGTTDAYAGSGIPGTWTDIREADS